MGVMQATPPVEAQKATGRKPFVWLTAALFVYISWEALRPNVGSTGIAQLDKLLHFSAFAALAVSSALAVSTGRRNSVIIAAALLLYGALIEILQLRVPGRDASALDLLADAAGIAAGLALAGLLQRLPALHRRR